MARVLIAEHNKTTSSYLSATLKKEGNSVEIVDNALEAWKASSKENFDILLVNILIPEMDGFVLAQKVLQKNSALRIIFITGFAGIAMETKSTPTHSQVVFTSRPFHLNEINSRIRYLMGEGGMPMKSTQKDVCDNVVYADFNNKNVSCHQISS
ncbi:MAG: response regulator [Alphaproteobacteria bacterium]|nr:response regulator [Alphaproteobacteria bacterium]